LATDETQPGIAGTKIDKDRASATSRCREAPHHLLLIDAKNTRIAKGENAKVQQLEVFFALAFCRDLFVSCKPSIRFFSDRSGRQEFKYRAATFNRVAEDKHEETWTG